MAADGEPGRWVRLWRSTLFTTSEPCGELGAALVPVPGGNGSAIIGPKLSLRPATV